VPTDHCDGTRADRECAEIIDLSPADYESFVRTTLPPLLTVEALKRAMARYEELRVEEQSNDGATLLRWPWLFRAST
jgi:hypothetical protein